jgi:hypothetical protein
MNRPRVNWLSGLPWVALLAVLLFSKSIYDGRRRAEGREAVALEQRRVALDSLAKERRRVDSVYVRDTVRLWRTVTDIRTLLDTLMLSDTVVLTKRESVIVYRADSAVNQCTVTVRSCEARVRVRDLQIDSLKSDRDHWRRKSQPSLLTQLSTASKWLAVGFLIGVTR